MFICRTARLPDAALRYGPLLRIPVQLRFHERLADVHGWYTQNKVDVDYVEMYGGWENSSWNFMGTMYLVDSVDWRNTKGYIEPLWHPFHGYNVTVWTWWTLNYQNPSLNPYVEVQWADDIGSDWCLAKAYTVIHGPNP
jgi:hypothetical protein